MSSAPDIQSEEIASLVARYATAAAVHGRATESGDNKKGNEAAKLTASVYRELRRRGIEAQRALLPLLSDSDRGVRLWAGAHALEFAPPEGERTLEGISSLAESLVSVSAKMTLREWRAGRLRFP